MRHLRFTIEEYTKELSENGYKVFNLLDEAAIKSLKEIFSKYHHTSPEGFYASTHLKDKSLRKEISDEALSIIHPYLEGKFENINVLGGAYISKAPGERGILPLHQDWNIVDEKKERSYNLWIPLQDVNELNGAMRVLEQSHAKLETYRGPGSKPILYNISDYVDRYMKSLNMKSGEALIYDHALWHSSPYNKTDNLRLAVVMGVVCKGADLRYYEQVEHEVYEYESHPLYFFENDRDGGPVELPLLSKINSKNTVLSKEDFKSIYLESSGREHKGILNKIKSFFYNGN